MHVHRGGRGGSAQLLGKVTVMRTPNCVTVTIRRDGSEILVQIVLFIAAGAARGL